MDLSDIRSKIITITAEQLSLREEGIKPSSRFVDDLGADSLDIVELVMEIEDEFGVQIPDEEIENMTVVQDVIAFIAKGI